MVIAKRRLRNEIASIVRAINNQRAKPLDVFECHITMPYFRFVAFAAREVALAFDYRSYLLRRTLVAFDLRGKMRR